MIKCLEARAKIKILWGEKIEVKKDYLQIF